MPVSLIASRGRFILVLIITSFFLTTITHARADQSNAVKVFAASSLQGSFNNLAKRYEKDHPGVRIIFSFGSSFTLANQIAAGAPMDIFVSADAQSMEIAKPELSQVKDYVVNRVVLAVPINSKIDSVSDLSGSVQWIQCVSTAPCGVAADAVLAQYRKFISPPVSLEASSSSTLAKLLSGSIDAAIIYKTDIVANKSKIKAIEFENKKTGSTQYKIAFSRSTKSKKNLWAKSFLTYLESAAAKNALVKAGFQR